MSPNAGHILFCSLRLDDILWKIRNAFADLDFNSRSIVNF